MATVPERFADRTLEPFGLIKRDLPIPVAESAIHQFWHSRLHRDPGHQWLRRFTCTLFGDIKIPNEEMPI
jgi:DNA-binding transcriptional LysR family regulator